LVISSSRSFSSTSSIPRNHRYPPWGYTHTREYVEAGELAVFEQSNQAIDFYAEADTDFVLGSAASHPYELVLGNHSVHTGPATLRAAERHIAKVQARLQMVGRL
jgi:hypothetical protein